MPFDLGQILPPRFLTSENGAPIPLPSSVGPQAPESPLISIPHLCPPASALRTSQTPQCGPSPYFCSLVPQIPRGEPYSSLLPGLPILHFPHLICGLHSSQRVSLPSVLTKLK